MRRAYARMDGVRSSAALALSGSGGTVGVPRCQPDRCPALGGEQHRSGDRPVGPDTLFPKQCLHLVACRTFLDESRAETCKCKSDRKKETDPPCEGDGG